MEDVLEALRQQHKHLIEMLRHMNEENQAKLNKILVSVGVEEEELREEISTQEKWFKQLAFQSAKIYGEEHELTKHYKEVYSLETGKKWDS
ncbi:hypothetical protein GOV10_02470 [Candidatus Woesearchaeota archaeon]|nr:hypothetical protein [Candidatus Woesearchaeota archaeon]